MSADDKWACVPGSGCCVGCGTFSCDCRETKMLAEIARLRKLAGRYVRTVVGEEGTDFLGHAGLWSNETFTDEEKAELRAWAAKGA